MWKKRSLTSVVLTVQFAVPAALLTARWITGEIQFYGWGWQMFSG